MKAASGGRVSPGHTSLFKSSVTRHAAPVTRPNPAAVSAMRRVQWRGVALAPAVEAEGRQNRDSEAEERGCNRGGAGFIE